MIRAIKLSLLTLSALGISSFAHAETWERVGGSFTESKVAISTYIDTASRNKSGNIQFVTVMRSVAQPVTVEGMKIQSTVTRMEFKCAEKQFRRASIKYYPQAMAAGTITKAIDPWEKGFYAVPGDGETPGGGQGAWVKANDRNVYHKVCG